MMLISGFTDQQRFGVPHCHDCRNICRHMGPPWVLAVAVGGVMRDNYFFPWCDSYFDPSPPS